jgi:RHS repeat-associated protein
LGCLKLTYRTNNTALKVAYSSYKKVENSCAGAYRYGFNGKEKVDEISGSGNSVDFGDRYLDTRLGRWNAVDKLASKYPYASPYNYCLNNPIYNVDPDGNSVAPADQASKNGFDAALKTTFSGDLASVYTTIGTVKVGDKSIDIKGFTFTGDINTAINSIKNSSLTKENKLKALAYLATVESKDVLYIQSPTNNSNPSEQPLIGNYPNLTADNQEYTNKDKTDRTIVAGDGENYEANKADIGVKVPDQEAKAKISGVSSLTEASNENIDKSVKRYASKLTPLDTKVQVKVKEGTETIKYNSDGDVQSNKK